MTQREAIKLTPSEQRRYNHLKPLVGEAFDFWKDVSRVRGLDYSTILFEDGYHTALLLGHGVDWCYPYPLICKFKPNIKI